MFIKNVTFQRHGLFLEKHFFYFLNNFLLFKFFFFCLFYKMENANKEIIPGELVDTRMIGVLYFKEVGKPITQLAEEITVSLELRSEEKFQYYLHIFNNDYHDNNDDTWKRFNFQITNDLHFKKYFNSEKNQCIMFQRKNDFYIIEFLVDEQNEKNLPKFLSNLEIFITSHDFRINLEAADKEKTKSEMVMNYETINSISDFIEENFKMFEEKDNIDDIVSKMDNLDLSTKKIKSIFPSATEVYSGKEYTAKALKYNKEKDLLDSVSNTACCKIYNVDSFTFILSVEESEGGLITFTKITSDISICYSTEDYSLMFLANPTFSSNSSDIQAFNIVFASKSELEDLKKNISKYQSISNYQRPYEEIPQSDREWIERENEPEEDLSSKESVGDIDFDSNFDETSEGETKNRMTAQAYLHDRTFVIKDDSTIAVYKTNEDEEKLSQIMTLPVVKTANDENIFLNGAQLYNSDTNLLFLDKNNTNTIWQYDIGSGKIVEEWQAPSIKNIISVAPETKFGQMTNNCVIQGIDGKNIFTMDSRVNKKDKVVNMKTYKTYPYFSCITTTDFGGLAIGSEDGTVRLYNGVGQIAKTSLSCFGDPIRAIDTTSDGLYLVATCDKYLMVISTSYKGESNGFVKRLGKEKKGPKTLKIKPVDITKYGLEREVFTPARFNICKNDSESTITSSIGQYIIVWNFNKIKKGIIDQYKLKKVNQFVIGNTFKYNKDQVVVTMEKKLGLQNQKKY